jgi:hypothetical protein
MAMHEPNPYIKKGGKMFQNGKKEGVLIYL